jgi:hypothetical protein
MIDLGIDRSITFKMDLREMEYDGVNSIQLVQWQSSVNTALNSLAS